MNIENIWAQLEQDLAWRTDEMRLLSNSRNGLKTEAERDRFRRAQLVMLYAHAEGFCKVAFLLYLKAINETGTPCSSVSEQLVASAFKELFHAVQFGDRKGKVFSAKLPSDTKLILAARRRDFVAEYEKIMRRAIRLSESIVDTEHNLNAAVLRRNLFRLGFAPDLMQQYEAGLDELVNRRNSIAHGSDDVIVKATDYDRLQKNLFQAFDSIAYAIIEALESGHYLCSLGNRDVELSWLAGEMR